MEVIIFAIALIAAFIAGVVFHKYVVSEAEKVKQHIWDSEARILEHIENLLGKGQSKPSGQ